MNRITRDDVGTPTFRLHEPSDPQQSQYGVCFGQRGYLTHHGNKIQCHICGNMFIALGVHVASRHEMSADEYRSEFRLGSDVGLVSDDLHRRFNRVTIYLKEGDKRADPIPLKTCYCVICGAPFQSRKKTPHKICQQRECYGQLSARGKVGKPRPPEVIAAMHNKAAQARGNAKRKGRKFSGRQLENIRAGIARHRPQFLKPCSICGESFRCRPSEAYRLKACRKPQCRRQSKLQAVAAAWAARRA